MEPGRHTRPIPRLPVFGWDTFSGVKPASVPSILDHANLIFTSSGRASIYQALRMLSIGPGDSVLVPTYHCPTMIAPIYKLGAAHVFYPIADSGSGRYR
ncbi:MAG: DegT/DnrJ/EryC1/StrS family aminotransferase [Betaproteobacteria bacterium]|nr:DegT/DnrJ/EryC1/StrS family aminotransferase [Betaproteobacteria bacterium]